MADKDSWWKDTAKDQKTDDKDMGFEPRRIQNDLIREGYLFLLLILLIFRTWSYSIYRGSKPLSSLNY
jgi:hypothetical protein